jgi:hypothetical protein
VPRPPKRAARSAPTQAKSWRNASSSSCRATAMPNGLSALGFDDSQLDALATGAEPQYRRHSKRADRPSVATI